MTPNRRFIFVASLALLATRAGAANLDVSFSGLPPSLTPGANFSVDVHVANATSLAFYNLEFLLTGPGTAGTDYFFLAADQPADHYLFTPDDDHFASAILTATAKNRAVVSDFLDSGSVNTLAGINDQVARLTIGTSASFSGPLHLALASDSMELSDPLFDPILGAAAIIANPPAAQIAVVPEPRTILALGGILMLLRRRSPL